MCVGDLESLAACQVGDVDDLLALVGHGGYDGREDVKVCYSRGGICLTKRDGGCQKHKGREQRG